MITRFRTALVSLACLAIACGSDPAAKPAVVETAAHKAQVARGKYLVDNVLSCGACHTPVGQDGKPDMSKYLAGSRSYDFDYNGQTISVYAENITSDEVEGIGAWSDDLLRAGIISGIDDVQASFWPIMPYPEYALLKAEDVNSIMAYLRTVPASSNVVAADTLVDPNSPAPPVNGFSITHGTLDPTDPLYAASERGRYLANAACLNCHSPERAQDVPDLAKAYAGGKTFVSRSEIAPTTSTNLTPDATGTLGWTVEDFVTSMKTDTDKDGRALCQTLGGAHQMAHMTDEDLNDLAVFFVNLAPIENGPFECHMPE